MAFLRGDLTLISSETRWYGATPTKPGTKLPDASFPRIATIVCGMAGEDRRRMQHPPMVHVFLRDGEGVVLRSRFWLGAALRPYLPAPLAAPAGALLNRPAVRRRMLPADVPRALAVHCAEEFANLGALLPELYARYAPGADALSRA